MTIYTNLHIYSKSGYFTIKLKGIKVPQFVY